MKKRILSFLAISLMLPTVFSCKNKNGPLDPNHPVTITIWHYYNGNQKQAFDALTTSFNETVGKKKGIYVESSSKGTVGELEQLITDCANEVVGAEPLPNLYSSYADTAYSIVEKGKLCDLTSYFSEKELSKYVNAYIDEGYIKGDKKLYLFPIAKSTEIMMINKTDWESFAKGRGITYSDLLTIEGVCKVAKQYYEYTDALTPDIPNDGKAFYGRDSMSNYFVTGMKQMGVDIFEYKNQVPTLNINEDKIKRLWENYYVPYVSGYFASAGKFRTDDVKMGKILAYTGSTSSVMFFPDKVIEADESSRNIEFDVLPIPIFKDGSKVNVQQGAGLAVTKSDELHEYASCEFLRWFTKKENNILFSLESSYLPVLKEANNISSIDSVISSNNLTINNKSYACIKEIMNSFDSMKFYTTISFKNCYSARKVLDYNLSDKAIADKLEIDRAIESGSSREEVLSSYTSDEAFSTWYEAFKAKLEFEFSK